MELPASGPFMPHDPDWTGSQIKKRVRNIIIIATTTIIVVVIVAVGASREIPI